MKVAWWDCSVAAAGDMLLGALLDAGASQERVTAGLDALGLVGWTLEVGEVERGAFRALRARFLIDGEQADHGHHHHHDHPHRPYHHVRTLITDAPLADRVRSRALDTYERLATAEAHLHGVPVDDVELHEVGSTDAILDIVGVCLALEDLGIDRVICTALPMGTGHTHAAHGHLPLPAPATLAVLTGWPVVQSGWPGEWVTPTGAALIASIASPGDFPPMNLGAVGHGAGHRNPSEVANLVRVVVGEASDKTHTDRVVELATNVDDLSGELVPDVLSKVLDAGALDVWAVPVHMKKGRPGLVLHALCKPLDADRISDVLLRHSSTLGVRRHTTLRRILDRWHTTVDTPYGEVRIKVGGRDDEPWHGSPEYEDVARRAEEASVPVHDVFQAALASWRREG